MNTFKIISILVLVLFYNLVGAQNDTNKYLVTYLEKRISSEEQINKINMLPKLLKDRLLKQINTGEEKFLFVDNDISVYSLKKKIKKLIGL